MTTWTHQTKHTTEWLETPKSSLDFLLKEDGGFLLQENNDYILLEQSVGDIWTHQTKHTTSWTYQSKS